MKSLSGQHSLGMVCDTFQNLVNILFKLTCKYRELYNATLPDYPGVSRIWHQSPCLLYGPPNLPNKFLFFFQKNLFHSKISGAFLHIYISNFITYRDCLDFRIIKVNFDDSYFT